VALRLDEVARHALAPLALVGGLLRELLVDALGACGGGGADEGEGG
jgi:hypothetical protein